MKLLSTTRYVDKLFEAAIVVIFATLVIVGGLQVFNRFVLNASLSWSEEFQKFAHIWLVYFSIPVAYNRGSHIGVELVLKVMPSAVRWTVALVTDLLWLGLSCAVIYFTYKVMQVAKMQTAPGLGITFDYAYLGLVIGGCYLFFVVARNLICHLTGAGKQAQEAAP